MNDAHPSARRQAGTSRNPHLQTSGDHEEQHFQKILESMFDWTWEVDEHLVVTYSSGNVERVLNYTSDEMVGKTMADLVPPGDQQALRAWAAKVLEEKRHFQDIELWAIGKNGERVCLLNSGVPVFDHRGRFSGIRGASRDITEKRRAEEELRQRNAQLEALRQVSLSITAELELDNLLNAITGRAMDLFGVEAGELFLYRLQSEEMEQVVAVGIQESRVSWEARRGEGLANQVWATNRPMILPRYAFWPQAPKTGESFVWGGAMGAPIQWRGEFLGVLGVISARPGGFSQAHMEMLELFATQAAVAIINARLYASVERLALVDELTGAFNLRGLFTLGCREVERAKRFGHNLSALFIDIDRFKELNDLHSHQTGDRMLRAVCEKIRESVRGVDLVARYGGDEFVVMLVEAGLESAFDVAERVRQSVQEIVLSTGPGVAIATVSIGIAGLGPSISDLRSLVHSADENMYEAKRAGRNRVFVRDDRAS